MKKKPTYHYRKKHYKRKKRILKTVLIFIAIVVAIGLLIAADIYRNRQQDSASQQATVTVTTGVDPDINIIDEPTYTLELPGDWVEFERFDNSREKGVTWIATKDKEDNRWVTIYMDKIPRDKALNRVVPVESNGQFLQVGNMSGQCHSFTPGATFDEGKAVHTRPKISKWEKVEFICNLPRPSENEIGTSSQNQINAVTMTGPKSGKHTYFFLFTDHNKQFKPQIFKDILNSFKVK